MAGINIARYPLTKIIDAKTAADTTAIWTAPPELEGQVVEWTFYVAFDHTSAAGTVLVESCQDRNYAGTWPVVATVAWAAIDKCHMVNANALYQAVRVRISSAVTSGTVTVWAMAATNS